MSRKLNIPKAAQIRGIRKALANRKTPRQFIPGLKKRLAKLTACIAFVAALCGCAARPAAAQAPVSLVPTQQILAAAGTTCTGSAQTFAVQNRNQTQHYAYIATNAAVTNLVMKIQGIDSAGNVYTISDTATVASPVVAANASLQGSGYFPTVQVVVTCNPAPGGTFLLSYSGGQAITNVNVGSYLLAQIDKTVSATAAANTNYSAFFQTPFGSAYGVLYFAFTGTGPAGSTLFVFCQDQNGIGATSETFNLATTTAVTQTFVVPALPCPNVTVQYGSGGASAATYNLDYVFSLPGSTQPNFYTHITGTTATVIKAGPGVVHSLVVGTSAAGTISLFDLVSGSCTGTPATNTVSVITEFASAAPPPPSYLYDVLFTNGICLKASAAMDITVSYQ